MSIDDFIPCIHLEDLRSFVLRSNDCLSDTLLSSSFNINVSSGKEEYEYILNYYNTQIKTNDKLHIQTVVELVAGTTSLNVNEKLEILNRVFKGEIGEDGELELIKQLKIEKQRLFEIFDTHYKLKKIFNVSDSELGDIMNRVYN